MTGRKVFLVAYLKPELIGGKVGAEAFSTAERARRYASKFLADKSPTITELAMDSTCELCGKYLADGDGWIDDETHGDVHTECLEELDN